MEISKVVPYHKVEECINIQNKNKPELPALHLAVINNDLEMVKLLLNQGVDVNQKIHTDECSVEIDCECLNSKYCFHKADEYGNEAMKVGLGQNALHLASKYSSEKVVKLLLDSIRDIDEVTDDKFTALHYATQNCTADNSDIFITKLLLQSGADIDAQTNQGKSPLYFAVKFEKLKLAAYLISMGANVNISTKNQSTPLYSALINCNVELVKLLLDHNAATDVKNKYDEDPLLFVLRVIGKGDERLPFVELLLDHGVKTDCRNSHGSTALHIAVQHKDKQLAKLLVARGCPLDSKDNFDMSPLSIAVCTNLKSLAKLLLEQGAKVNDFVNNSSVLEHAIIRRNEAMVQLLLEHDADVDIGNERNKPVAAACLHKDTNIMQLLIDKGADINYKDKNGRTPLMRTIKEPNYMMMKHLLKHGACVNEQDYDGNTAFHVLFENGSHTKENIIKYLLDEGADINIENNNGHTPFSHMMFKCFTKGEVLIFVRHIALLLAQNLYVNPKIMMYIKNDNTWGEYFNSCQRELERMREIRLVDNYSYLDVIIKRCSALTSVFQHENIESPFHYGIHENNFSNYTDILLPPEIVEKICEYLSNEHLSKYL